MNKKKNVQGLNVSPAIAKPMLAADLINWLETERTILFNHAGFMLDPVEYRKTMDVIYAINTTVEYVKLSKICG